MTTLHVKVKPNSRVAVLEELDDGTWLARLKAAPVEGKANAELIALLAKRFQVRRAQVSIRRGATGRAKVVEIEETNG